MDAVGDGWLARAAAHLGVEPLTPEEIEALLDAARDIAHGTERRYAPLTCFLLGVAAAGERSQVVMTSGEVAALARKSDQA